MLPRLKTTAPVCCTASLGAVDLSPWGAVASALTVSLSDVYLTYLPTPSFIFLSIFSPYPCSTQNLSWWLFKVFCLYFLDTLLLPGDEKDPGSPFLSMGEAWACLLWTEPTAFLWWKVPWVRVLALPPTPTVTWVSCFSCMHPISPPVKLGDQAAWSSISDSLDKWRQPCIPLRRLQS